MALAYETNAVLFEVRDGIAIITLNRPEEGNSIDEELKKGVVAAWEEVKRNDDILVAIITGAGERHFCAGASMSTANTDDGGMLKNGTLREATQLSSHSCDVWKPVICAINGLVNGGGFHFVVDADVIIAPQSAAFMDTHTTIGAVGGVETVGLARRMTMGGALLLSLAGKSYRMTAERAYQLGLVDILEPTPKDVMHRALELAAAMAKNSPQAMRASKQAIWNSGEMGYQNAMEFGWTLVKNHWAHPDLVEGAAAFGERREPKWNRDPNARS